LNGKASFLFLLNLIIPFWKVMKELGKMNLLLFIVYWINSSSLGWRAAPRRVFSIASSFFGRLMLPSCLKQEHLSSWQFFLLFPFLAVE
jgi:hypothetical protein